MKNLFKQSLSIIAILLASVFAVNAQGPTGPSTGTATLNLKINAMQSITVESPSVDLEYTTVDNYVQGVSSLKENHLRVFSSKAFVVTVKADAFSVNGTSVIPTNTIKVLASNGPTNNKTFNYNEVTLESTPKPLISRSEFGNNERFNVTYTGADNGRYIQEAEGVYTTIVTYTISPQ